MPRALLVSVARRDQYPVAIEAGLLRRAGRWLDDRLGMHRRLVVSSPRVWKHHGAAARAGRLGEGPVLVRDGETAKTLDTTLHLYQALIRHRVDRGTVVIVMGGGVLGDLAGYAAATLLRGLPLVHVPTTLVGQIDSAIGGKVGVNLPAGKNLVGAFYQPEAVLVDPTLLVTLPAREFRAGLYEAIKYGIIGNARLFRALERASMGALQVDGRALDPIVRACAALKARIVSKDERDTGARLWLNLGHTVGHALEQVTRYRRFKHGEAVGYGLLVATRIAAARCTLAPAAAARIETLIGRIGRLPRVHHLSARTIVAATALDKKIESGRRRFVLPSAIGAVTVVDDVSNQEIERALQSLGCGA